MLEELGPADPARVGPYELVGVLGSGGMGRVYLGRTADGDQAAVKVIHADLARDPEFRRRFAREADSTRNLVAPGVALVLAADPDAELPWLATEYVDGPSLHHVVTTDGALQPTALRELGAGLAEALAAVHAAGLVHRDVKPPNVLLSATGPKLIDFGIARDLAASTITRTGIALGTPQFMAPEQLQAERTVGAPADVFALAGLLVFAATGDSPFGEGTPLQLLFAVASGEPRLDGVPAPLRPLLARCLAKDPELRPTAAEVAAELGGDLGTHQVQVQPGELLAAPHYRLPEDPTPPHDGSAGGPTPPHRRSPEDPTPPHHRPPEDRTTPPHGSAEEPLAAAPHYRPPGEPPTERGGKRRRALVVAAVGVVAAVALALTVADGNASGSGGGQAGGQAGAAGGPTAGAAGTSTSSQDGPVPTPTGGTAGPGGPTGASSASASKVSTSASGGGASTGSASSASAPGPTHPTPGPGPTRPTTASTSAVLPTRSSTPSPKPTTSVPSSSSGTATCGSVPCRLPNPVVKIAHTNDTANPSCLNLGVEAGGSTTAAAAGSDCSGPVAQWKIWRGSVAGTAQFEETQTPGQCMSSVGANGAADMAACNPADPAQWFYADAGGGTAQLKSYGGTIGCLNVFWFLNAPLTQIGGCSTGPGNMWRLS